MIQRETKMPRDYEVMDSVLDRGDAVELARMLSVSPQLVRSWCRPPETEDEFSTGKFGPLARLRTLFAMIREDDGEPDRAFPIAKYIAGLLGGIFVPLPPAAELDNDELMERVSIVLMETGEAIEATRAAWFENTPGKISNRERAECVAEIDDAITALVTLKRWIDTKGRKS